VISWLMTRLCAVALVSMRPVPPLKRSAIMRTVPPLHTQSHARAKRGQGEVGHSC
jgi:hypothetical protein